MHHAAFCLQQLKSCELFRELNDLELNDLYASMARVKIEPGEVLVAQGDISDCMYVLLSGRLLVKQADGSTIGQIGRGQTVGEMGLITNEPRSASVIAMRESLLLKLDRASFTELWTRHPSVLFEVTKIITQRLQKTLKVRQRYNNASNIVVLQANQRADIKLFFEELYASFDQRFRYRILRRSDFSQKLSEEQFHQQVRDLEHHYDYLFYEIGFQQDEWRELCLGNADRILVLADGSSTVNYDPEIVSELTGVGVHQEIKKILVLLHGQSQPRDTRAWLQPIPFFRHYHVRFNRREDFSRLLRLLNGTAIGLVLGGGGTRSWAQVGVMKYVYEQKIPIDAYAGTSAGSMNAASLAIARDYDDYLKIGRQLAKCVNFKEYTIPLCSILSSKSLTSALKEAFGETRIEDLEKLVICVAGDLFKSTEVDIQEGLLWHAVRASLSLPGIYPPVYVKNSGQLLVDGGVVNNLPVDVMRNYFEGFGKIISVDISDVRNAIADYNYPMELTWQTILREKYFSRPCTLNIPSITNTFMQGLMLSTDQKANANALLSNINIKPSLAGFALLDSTRNDELIDIGYAYAQKNLANWREDLNFNEMRLG